MFLVFVMHFVNFRLGEQLLIFVEILRPSVFTKGIELIYGEHEIFYGLKANHSWVAIG